MTRFPNLTVGTKLYGSFGLVVVLLAAVAGTAFWSMGRLESANSRITGHANPLVVAVEDVRYDVRDVDATQTAYVLDRGKSRASFEQAAIALNEALTNLERVSGARDLAAEARIESLANEVFRIDGQIWSAVKAKDFARAQALRVGAETQAIDRTAAAAEAVSSRARREQAAASASFASAKSLATVVMFVLSGVAVVVSLLLAFLIARIVTRAVTQLLAAARGIAAGDVEQTVEAKSNDELGQTATAFQAMIAYLERMADAAEAIADGDLTLRVEPESERDVLGRAFARMTESLRTMIGQLSDTATTMGAASEEMASTSEEAGKAVSEIALAVGDIASGAERQVRVVEEARQSAQETGEAAEQAREAAHEGVGAADQAAAAMQALQESNWQVTGAIRGLAAKSEQIGGIVETITGIASQTNLLALNAAIEAARAGEQGRGFAIVAEEVRKLAEDSQRAATHISTLVHEIQDETEKTVEVVEAGARRTEESTETVRAAREAFRRIGEQVEEMTARIALVVEATNEVASVAQETSASTQQVSASTEETSASAEEIAASAQDLAVTAEELQQLVGRFRLEA